MGKKGGHNSEYIIKLFCCDRKQIPQIRFVFTARTGFTIKADEM